MAHIAWHKFTSPEFNLDYFDDGDVPTLGVDIRGWNVLHYVCRYTKSAFYDMRRNIGGRRYAIRKHYGPEEVVKRLLYTNGLYTNVEGRTPLHIACRNPHMTVATLEALGTSDVGTPTVNGKVTPIDLARKWSKRASVVKWLQEHGAGQGSVSAIDIYDPREDILRGKRELWRNRDKYIQWEMEPGRVAFLNEWFDVGMRALNQLETRHARWPGDVLTEDVISVGTQSEEMYSQREFGVDS